MLQLSPAKNNGTMRSSLHAKLYKLPRSSTRFDKL